MQGLKQLFRAFAVAAAFLMSSRPVDAAPVTAVPPGMAVATFAGGCFWCMEPPFDVLDGVVSTTSGYIGGKVANPTYGDVSAGRTGHTEAVEIGKGRLDGRPIAYGSFIFAFMGGSMGSVVGERFVRGVETALEQKTPFVSFTATGGARMQEGLLSLLQMAKTNAALTRLAKAKLPYVSVLTDPTMGGVSASFAFVGDVVIAEPKALIGFAGPRVIENTVREKLPEGFQRAEFLLGKGAVDMIVDRRELRATIARSVAMLQRLSADAVA